MTPPMKTSHRMDLDRMRPDPDRSPARSLIGGFDTLVVYIAGLTSSEAAGIHIVDVGESERQDVRIWRVKWYCGLALFSEKGIAIAAGITN